MNPLAGVLAESWAAYRRFAGHLLPTAFVVYLGISVLDLILVLAAGTTGQLIGAVVSLAGVFLVQAALVRAVEDIRDGRVDLSVAETLRAAGPRVAAVALASLVAAVAIGIGMLLLVVPGLVIGTFLSLIVPVIVVENARASEAFRRSAELVRGYGWYVFGVLVVTVLVYLAGGVALSLLLAALPRWASGFVADIATGTVLSPFVALVLTLTYYRLADRHAADAAARDIWTPPVSGVV